MVGTNAVVNGYTGGLPMVTVWRLMVALFFDVLLLPLFFLLFNYLFIYFDSQMLVLCV